VNFVEREKAVAIAAVVDESRLQRRLDARDLRQIDVATEQFASGALVIELLYSAIAQYHHPSLLGVGGIDKHLVSCHFLLSFARR
jgi:hypothetical protein